ncbi:MAG: hypothetical protein H6606_09745 [Flavobacteriales bacterium]|nr:hypothetical protein [Flavobacteriales bacterium]
MNFELFNTVSGSSTVLRIAVNEVFTGHKDKPRYKLNDFSLYGSQLFLLVHNTVYVFDILDNNVCELNGKYSFTTHGFQWMTVIGGEKVLLIDLVNSAGREGEIVIYHVNLIDGKIEISKSLRLPFSGKPYLQTEATYISETADKVYIGNATSSRVNVFDKSLLEWKDSLNLGNAVGFKQMDSLKFLNKMQFFEALGSDTNEYHYQSCYASDKLILRARCKTPGKSVHYLDIHHHNEHGWDSLTTMVEGVYNSRRKGDEAELFTAMHFDPMSSTRSHILVGDRFYSPGFKYNLRRSEESDEFVTYFFSVNELISMSKELFKSKDFSFVLYEYGKL